MKNVLTVGERANSIVARGARTVLTRNFIVKPACDPCHMLDKKTRNENTYNMDTYITGWPTYILRCCIQALAEKQWKQGFWHNFLSWFYFWYYKLFMYKSQTKNIWIPCPGNAWPCPGNMCGRPALSSCQSLQISLGCLNAGHPLESALADRAGIMVHLTCRDSFLQRTPTNIDYGEKKRWSGENRQSVAKVTERAQSVAKNRNMWRKS